MKIYLIPGLGFDQRMFQKLDLKGLDIEYIHWIEPKQKEDIHDYARRLFSMIDNREDNILIGHSFGGIVAQEIAKVKKIKKIILISSIKSRKELPLHFKIVQPLRIYKFFTKGFCLKTVRFWGKNHGYESREEVDLFKSMVGQQSNTYLQWALKALSVWNPSPVPKHTSIFHIHGDKDQTFPIGRIQQADVVIRNAGHFMVYKGKHNLNQIILEVLDAV